MTPMYKITPPNFGNEFHSKVEDAAIHNVDNVHAAQEAIKKYDAILNQLEHIHRKILFEKFIHNYQDIVIMIDIPYEERQYKREKRKAVIELATTLGVEVLKKWNDYKKGVYVLEEFAVNIIISIVTILLAILALVVACKTLVSTDLPKLRITSSREKMSRIKAQDNNIKIEIKNNGNRAVCQLYLLLVVKEDKYKYKGWFSIKEKQYFLSNPVYDLAEKEKTSIVIDYSLAPEKSKEIDYFKIVQDYNGSKYKMNLRRGDKHNHQLENWGIPTKKIHFYDFYWLIKFKWFQMQAKRQKHTYYYVGMEELRKRGN